MYPSHIYVYIFYKGYKIYDYTHTHTYLGHKMRRSREDFHTHANKHNDCKCTLTHTAYVIRVDQYIGAETRPTNSSEARP